MARGKRGGKGSGRKTFVMSSPATLHAIYTEARRGFSRAHGSVVVELDALSEAENDAATRRVGRFYSACGCAEGAASGAVGLIGYSLVAYSSESIGWWDLPKVVAVFFVAVSVGKFLGLWVARVRLRRELEAFLNQVGWPDQARPDDETGPCGIGGEV